LPADAAPGLLLLAELPSAGAKLRLSTEESHYVLRVCRARPGEIVSGTDGRGGLATLRVIEGGARVTVEVETCDRRLPSRQAWVLVGAPEGERGDWMVEKLGELGVSVFQPVDCERGRWESKQERADRWQRLATAALRQSRRRFLLEVMPRKSLTEAMADVPAGAYRWLADPGGPAAGALTAPREGIAVALVGPSTGLAAAERTLAESHGFQPICLSDGRLRAETAAVSWAAWWSAAGPGTDATAPASRPS
jgi:16S rRNA (uracil1498-N3)-methyltransferase